MRAIIVEEWDIEIIEEVIDIAREFIEETAYPITFNHDLIYGRLSDAYFHDDGDLILVLDDEDNVAGGAVVWAVSDYQPEKFGYVEKLFVSPRMRFKGAGRLLVEKVAAWFDERSCVLSFATSTANIGQARLFENLMSRYGYQGCGPTLARKAYHGKI